MSFTACKTVECAHNTAAYWAECLHHKMEGFGTRDRDVIRITVSRCEIDLADIKVEYENKYDKTLESDVKVGLKERENRFIR